MSKQLLRTCARLGIALTHSKPGRPEGRGKIERFFRTVRDQFVVEIPTTENLHDVAELNRLFASWVEAIYHHRVHSETGQNPLERYTAVEPPDLPSSGQLREAFLWAEERTVTKTATVSMFSNEYEVDAALCGQRVELVFDPFDLTDIDVNFRGRAAGKAVPFVVGRHVHPQAKPEIVEPAAPTGIDYLNITHAEHDQRVTDQTGITYSQIPLPDYLQIKPKNNGNVGGLV